MVCSALFYFRKKRLNLTKVFHSIKADIILLYVRINTSSIGFLKVSFNFNANIILIN